MWAKGLGPLRSVPGPKLANPSKLRERERERCVCVGGGGRGVLETHLYYQKEPT